MKTQEIIKAAQAYYPSGILHEEAKVSAFVRGAKWAAPKWLPIDRDKNGFATEECLDEMFTSLPIVVAQKRSGESILYESICDLNDVYAWRGEIDRDADYTHYLPISKLES